MLTYILKFWKNISNTCYVIKLYLYVFNELIENFLSLVTIIKFHSIPFKNIESTMWK